MENKHMKTWSTVYDETEDQNYSDISLYTSQDGYKKSMTK